MMVEAPATARRMRETWTRVLPILSWAKQYERSILTADLVAAVIVTIMLIPQSLAYAQLAGLKPEVGLYASVAPLIIYALFGSSRVLAVGPVAVASLMTAAAIGVHAPLGSELYWSMAITLAFLSGAILLLMGIFRLGFLANFLSHSVISGFITASGILIAASQLKTLFGVKASGGTLVELLPSLFSQLGAVNVVTLAIGLSATIFLFWVRKGAKPALIKLGLPARLADVMAKAGPVLAIAVTTWLAFAADLSKQGVQVVGNIPQGFPPLTLPVLNLDVITNMLGPAILISIVGFAESVSVGQTLAAKRRQRIEPDQELIALGASNLGASFTGGFPVTGGFARSVVNFDAGAQTPAAGVFTAVGITLASLFLTPALYYLPQATLAATIVVAVLSLVDFSILKRTWRYSKPDFLAVAVTIVTTLTLGVELGLVAGVGLSLLAYLYKTSRPHIAVVGQVPGTEHFRNVHRHQVQTSPRVLSLRVDESLYFANARTLEDFVNNSVSSCPQIEHVILQCSAVNDIDASALESLENIEHRLKDAGVKFHLSEVKGPVMDRLAATDFLHHLRGQVFLSHFQAIRTLCPEMLG